MSPDAPEERLIVFYGIYSAAADEMNDFHVVSSF
jgi:hypothetical protein